jgi:hypothetical protein
MPEPKDLVESIERGAELPEGDDESFVGYGVMGLPFESGHVPGLRRFPASSLGPGYSSVWHRDPEGRWRFYQDVAPQQSCPRYFGSVLTEAAQEDIQIRWTGPRTFSVELKGAHRLSWDVSLAASPATRMMNAIGSAMPSTLWRNRAVLRSMGAVASVALGAGKLGLVGIAPNGQAFMANPKLIWFVPSSRAEVDGRDLGGVGPLAEQERLGDFWIPQRGIFVIGGAFFEPFEEGRHTSATSRAAGVVAHDEPRGSGVLP